MSKTLKTRREVRFARLSAVLGFSLSTFLFLTLRVRGNMPTYSSRLFGDADSGPRFIQPFAPVDYLAMVGFTWLFFHSAFRALLLLEDPAYDRSNRPAWVTFVGYLFCAGGSMLGGTTNSMMYGTYASIESFIVFGTLTVAALGLIAVAVSVLSPPLDRLVGLAAAKAVYRPRWPIRHTSSQLSER